MNDLILYVVSGIAVVCLFVMLYFELKAGYSLRKALKDTLGFGARRILLGFGMALFLIVLYKLADWLWEALL
jgi:hypothetical protein